MRKDPLVTGEYYHIYNRGVDKRDVFMNQHDLARFILSVKLFNTVKPIGSIELKKREHADSDLEAAQPPELAEAGQLQNEPLISVVCYCFNPNHFHFIIKQEVDGGISEFFKRLLGGYTYYFNKIHDRSGSLFQGRFKSNLINDDQYFLTIRPYVNMNYSIHNIPSEKSHLVWASDGEYDSGLFDIVSKEEAKNLLDFYGSKENFKSECIKVTSIIRAQRGNTSLLEEDLLP